MKFSTTRMGFVLAGVSALLFVQNAAADQCNFNLRGTSQECTITFNGALRTYLLHIPSNFSAGNALLFSFGGSPCYQETDPSNQGCGSYQEWLSNLSVKSDQSGFVAVYP